jgi:hypothetical protein
VLYPSKHAVPPPDPCVYPQKARITHFFPLSNTIGSNMENCQGVQQEKTL